MQRTWDADVIVVGSGFGGSVAAMRAADKGYRVIVLEAGRRFADEDFAKTSWDLGSYVFAPRLGLWGVQRVHALHDVVVLAGAGVGGGSLNYGCTLFRPPRSYFEDPAWAHITDWEAELAPHYEVAERMLGVSDARCSQAAERVVERAAALLGRRESLRPTAVGITSGEPGEDVGDPHFGGAGPHRRACQQCGNCMVGCRHGAKNTLVKNYLWFAEQAGVRIVAQREVVDIRPIDATDPSVGYRVVSRRSGGGPRTQTLTAGQVVLAAGTYGTQTLLHNLAVRSLPMLSPALGSLTRTNSEALGGAMLMREPDADLTKGIAITRSLQVDDVTHVEFERYGRGSDALGMLATVLADVGPGKSPLVAWLRAVARHPARFLRTLNARGMASRSIIALVMQSEDNALQTFRRRGRLQTRRAPGVAPSPVWTRQATTIVEALARAMRDEHLGDAFPIASVSVPTGRAMTGHFLGGCVMGERPREGVIDPYHRVWNYPGLHVVDGSAVTANLGVNPALTITAQAERALSFWPRKGECDLRPPQGADYVPLPSRPGRVPDGSDGNLSSVGTAA